MKSNARSKCPFCNISSDEIVAENLYWVLVMDKYPVNKGHMLAIPKHHVMTAITLVNEIPYLHDILNHARVYLRAKFRAQGFNIGINEGEVAGQTIDHLHVHIIPRYAGDVQDPRGGIRNIKKPVVEH